MMRTAAPIGLSFALFAALFFFSERGTDEVSEPATHAALSSVSSEPAPHAARASAAPGRRANILLLLTDDQDYLLESTRREHMPLLRAKVADAGVHVEYAFATTPECCPSRASILTGRFVHNTHVVNNTASGNCASVLWARTGERATLAVHLQRRNYSTFFAGKYMNEYGSGAGGSSWVTGEHLAMGYDWVPPGWDAWFGTGPETLIAGAGGGDNGDVLYWNFTVSDNGEPRDFPAAAPENYATHVWGNRSLHWLRQRASAAHADEEESVYRYNTTSSGLRARDPFFMMVSFTAPHEPASPAPEYASDALGLGLRAPRTPNWNVLPTTPHLWVAASGGGTGPMNATQADFVDYWYRRRLLTLRTVDEWVGRLVDELDAMGELDDTYVVFTSDHGFHLGQFGMVGTKELPYDTDVRVPFFARGPGLPANVTRGRADGFAALVDLAPTWYDLAGGDPSSIGRDAPGAPPFDGTSLLPMLEGRAAVARADVIMEHQGQYSTGCSINGGVVIGAGPLCDVLGPGALAGPPYFEGSDEQFCKCHDAGNNSWACVRTLTSDLNRLFCRIGTSPLDPVHMRPHYEEYDLASDPWAITNRIDHLSDQHINLLIARVDELQHCVGFAQCSSSNVTSRIERAYSENRALRGS